MLEKSKNFFSLLIYCINSIYVYAFIYSITNTYIYIEGIKSGIFYVLSNTYH